MNEMMRGILLRMEREFIRAACRSGVLVLWSRWVGAKEFGKGEFEDTEGELKVGYRWIVGRINLSRSVGLLGEVQHENLLLNY